MKKKAIGFIALAMTLMANTAAFAIGGVGDIVSIDPCNEYGIKQAVDTTPKSAGETAYFRIRLLNANCRMSYDTKDSAKRTSPWQPDYNGLTVGSGVMEQMWLANPPKIGVYVSGVLRGATIGYPYAVEMDDDGSWAGWYTDLICSYTVKPGDLALPMTLSNAAGIEIGTGGSGAIFFNTIPATSVWRLRADDRAGRNSDEEWNTVVATNYCQFTFNGGSVDLPATYTPVWCTDYNLRQAGLYLKSVDFHATETSVSQGRTEKVTVDILGGANTNGNGTVYVMTKDLDAIDLAENVVETVDIVSTPARDTDGTYHVSKVTIPSGDDATEFSFKVYGVEKGKSGTVYLSTTKEFVYGDSGDLVTNFVTTVVKCVEPPPPYITVDIDGVQSKSVTANANYTDYAAKLTVTLSEAYTDDFTVNVTPSMVSGSGVNPFGNYIGVSAYSENGYQQNATSVSFTAAEMANGTLSKSLYIYVLGASDDTDGINKGIVFNAAAQAPGDAYFNNENVPATLSIKKSTPVIVDPVEGFAYTKLAGGVESAFVIKIADNYADMQKPYTVQWYKTGSGNPLTFHATPNADGELTVSVKYNAGTYTSRFRVKSDSGNWCEWSDMRTVSVQVNAAKQVFAVVESPDDSLRYTEDAEELTIRFKLTEAYDDQTLYAFLIPQDEASSNLVVCKQFTQGVAISAGDTNSTGVALMTLLDGNDQTMPLVYEIMLRTGKTLTTGEIVGTYESKNLEIYISNKAPVVSAVNMSGSAPVTVNNGTFKGKASMGLNKIFTLDAADVEADLTNDVIAVWTFSDPNGNAVTVTSDPAPLAEIVLTNVFEVAGTYDCSVKLHDKDMGVSKYGPQFDFHVIVLDTPTVQITYPNSEQYSELSVLNRTGFFYVELSTPCTKPLDVDLVCTRVGADGLFVLSTNQVSFRANQSRVTVNIDDLDGTGESYSTRGGFELTATVTTTTPNEDGVPLNEVYLPATERVYVFNENPTIVQPVETGFTNDAAINVNIPIRWVISDVDADMTNDLTVTWTTSEGRYQEFKGSEVATGVFTNMFTSGGDKTVTITVTDKDGGSASATLFYKVAPSKRVHIYPQGPYYGGGLSPIAKTYVEADGRGAGRVWAQSGSTLVEDFAHRLTYGTGDTSASLYAIGYRNGQVDDGNLTDGTGKSGRDTALDANGDSFPLGTDPSNCYTYEDGKGRDSFFYAWILDSREEEATTFTGTAVINPPSRDSSNRFSSYSVGLPTEQSGDDANPVFPDRYIEAIFSRELYVADNMGDINADGIPDWYATRLWDADSSEGGEGGKAYIHGGSQGAGEGEGGAADDLKDVSGYNTDGDHLPACWSLSGNPLKPIVLDWGPGENFNALYEIRGIGESASGHLGLNELGVSEYDLSPAERYALLADYVAAGNALTGGDDYAAATNWAKSVSWTPEAINPDKNNARLNPLMADTDGDGFDDGWEYFFWYYAKIGFVDGDGNWGRLEGRKYDISSPASSTRISSSAIVDAFNPHVKVVGGRDFDNDGLSDLEEYALGTNPCDWDSDNDGMNDLWEVMNGLNPLSADADGNPDYDYMARCEFPDDTFMVVTFASGEIFGLPTATAPTFDVETIRGASTNGFALAVVDDNGSTNTYVAASLPQVDAGNGEPMLSADVECFPAFVSGGTVYVTSLETVPVTAGAKVASAATEEAEYELFSGFYRAELSGSGEVVWFSGEKPKVILQNGTGLPQLAADTAGFATYTHLDGKEYIGAARTVPAGTLFDTIADAPVNMYQVYVSPYMKDSGGFVWTNPKTMEQESTILALPLFNYGGDGTTYVPCTLTVDRYCVAPVAPDRELLEEFGYELPEGFTRSPVVKVETECKITLIHNQVLKRFGYDPRTAWNIDDGLVSKRWSNSILGSAGLVANTMPYTSLDEYLVMQYRQQLRKIESGVRSETESLLTGGDGYIVGNDDKYMGKDGSLWYFRNSSTYPSCPVEFVRSAYAGTSEASRFGNSTNSTMVAYWNWLEVENVIHGADTDNDGVPDGWELYVESDPNVREDGSLDKDNDGLTLRAEFAGVDSCNAYMEHTRGGKVICPEVTSITDNHTGRNSGWWNKFFPTNPNSGDTDGDGVGDKQEGEGFRTDFAVGNNSYGTTSTSFIYGTDENSTTYDADYKTVCFRGGGLNPCTVDTDGDLLPDGWERQFAGIIFKDGAAQSVSLKNSDERILTMADGKQKAVAASGSEIRGGMDGTWGPNNNLTGSRYQGDSCLDFDHDGLVNCQEYLVQTLRHLRYDDDKTPLMGIDPNSRQFLKFIPFSAWDGEFFHKKCIESGFTGLGAWQYAKLGYFTTPPHEWDMLAQNMEGLLSCANYAPAGYRVMLPPVIEIPLAGEFGGSSYVTTDPRRWDSDEDNMDDYYELFHGLNPLLGTASNPDENDEYGWPNQRYDVIAQVYGGVINVWRNSWTGFLNAEQPAMDAIRYPWMMGTMECDADGDGLRNDEEALKVDLAKPSNTHTDPTPLWMTDSTSIDNASYTSQYYAFDPYITETPDYDPNFFYPDVLTYPWEDMTLLLRLRGMGASGESRTWMFSFEENEGYDTDHDFKRDAVELTRGVEMPSDPRMFTDPDRRQALYFTGDNSAAASRDGQFRRAASTEPDLFKQFTVECWAKPEGANANAVLIERVCNYGASTLSNNTSILRANFRVGIDGDGKAYGEFQGSTANSGSVRVTSPKALAADEWTHIAFTFDGSTASLYLNGAQNPVAETGNVGLLPANGIYGIQQEYYTPVMQYGYIALPCATLLGADALNSKAIALGKETQWTDFGSFYKGWIDEVRIWDGARTASEIHDSYRKRFTMDDVKEMRSNSIGTGVFDKWFAGCTRAKGNLPAELIQHYNFTTLPGGIEPWNVLTEPTGFEENVFDNVRKTNGRILDSSLLAGWWSQTPVHSTVYWNYAVIPWIGNTVAHLPFMDGSSADSQYWSEEFAGVILHSFDTYDYPNTANPYPYYLYHRERHNRLNLLSAVASSATNVSLSAKWQFQLRSDFVGTSDLVPLGGAFAKRSTDFWDGQGAMDAWVETAADGELVDADGNGIPDWAEDLGYTTAADYLLALREGLLPDGTVAEEYQDVADANRNGLADWWERFYGLSGVAITDDADRDGLSTLAEYLAMSDYGEWLDPTKAMTDGEMLDYFRRMRNGWYLGVALTDHDFIEDWWEDKFSVDAINRYVYDALNDSDGDGWSNWAERRAGTDPSSEATLSLVSASTGDDNVLPGYPEPLIHMALTYDSTDAIKAGLVVKAWRGSSPSGIPDAVWKVNGSDAASTRHTRFLGFNPNRTVNLNLGPGMVAKGSLSIEFFDPTYIHRTVLFDTNHNVIAVNDTVYSVDSSHWTGILGFVDKPSADSTSDIGTFKGGTLNYRTGDITIDFTQWQDPDYTEGSSTATQSDSDHYKLNESYVRVSWKSRLVGSGLQREIYFSTADTDAESLGHLREGKNTFEVFADTNGNGEWDEGEPFGMVKDVEVGWSRVVGLTVGLTADSAAMKRLSASSSEEEALVRIMRTSINGVEMGNRVVFKRNIKLNGRPYISEADIARAGQFDLDWATLVRDAEAAGIRADDIAEVGYSVSIGEAGDSTNGVRSFTKEFPVERKAPIAVRSADTSGYKVLTTRPEFVWTSDAGYTAFVLEIATNAAADAVVWSSGTNLLPAATEEGFTYKAPAFVGRDLEDGTKYFWRVAQLNAKWPTVDDSAWSEWAEFETAVDSTKLNTGYGRLSVDVRYYGPADSDKGSVYVAAYATPDFSGVPEAALWLPEGDIADLAVFDNPAGFAAASTNNLVTFDGLKPGSYYVMAFVDRNGNGKRDAFETWGYANFVAKNVESMYDPAAFEVSSTAVEAPAAVVFMEDTDINQNGEPDCGEDLALMESAVAIAAADGDEAENWGDWAGGFDLDVAEDATFAANGDVMAYATTNVWMVALDDGSEFLVIDRSKRPQVGDEAADYELWTTYRYGWGTNFVNGVGTNAAANAGARIKTVFDVEAALVHAQVYEAFGYDPLTANPIAYANGLAVNTKPFTALDKYLVCRYFENVYGLADEAAMNTNGTWSAYTLKPGDPDNNKDGIPDGWELYVMFGPDGATAELADAEISPFAEIGGVSAAEYVRDAANTPDGDGLTILEEFDGGNTPTDPWQTATLGLDGLTDVDAYAYHLKTVEDQLADEDNDGLSNWAEYLAQADKAVAIDNAYTFDTVLDYFLRVTKNGITSYLGWFYTDHDFIEDAWEDEYDVTRANRYAYDARRDLDGDGWSNYAEARAGTDPTRSVSLTVDGATVAEHPTPVLQIGFPYNGSRTLDGDVVLRAFKSGASAVEAEWKMNLQSGSAAGAGDSNTNKNVKILGSWHPGTVRFTLSPSSVRPGSVQIQAKDPGYRYHTTRTDYSYYYYWYGEDAAIDWQNGDAASATWDDVIYDLMRSDDTTHGDLIYKMGEEKQVVGWIDYESGLAEIDLSLVSGYFTTKETEFHEEASQVDNGAWAWLEYKYRRMDLESSYFRALYMSEFISQGSGQKFYFTEPQSGLLREGTHDFFAFADLDGDGELTAGEPSGFVRGVDVGWDRVSDLSVELKDGSPIFPAFTIDSSNDVERVRIYRTSVNGETVQRRLAWIGDVDLTARSWLSEMDFVNAGTYDFDWKLGSDSAAIYNVAPADLTTVGYTVFVGRGTNAVAYAGYEKQFKNGIPELVAPSEGAWYLIHTAQPEFKWKGTSGFPAYVLQVASDEGFSSVVYAETNFMPAAFSEGFAVKPALWVGDGLADNTEYFWRVAAIDARNGSGGAALNWSDVAKFKTAVDSANSDTGYGKLAADIRYYGAMDITLGDVVVAVYKTADFTGVPVARKRLSDSCGSVVLAKETEAGAFMEPVPNVTFDGIAPGDYYVMAFVDLNGNGKRDPYEIWGYVNKVGTQSASLYTPVALTVSSTKVDVPAGIVFMEDTDINQNATPDCLEDQTALADATRLEELDEAASSGSSSGSSSGESGSGETITDEDGDGIPDSFEEQHGLDPDDPVDMGSATIEDVMAYAVTNLTVITVWDGANAASATNKFVVMDANAKVNKGDNASTISSLRSIYDYGGQYGLGAACTLPAFNWVYEVEKNAEVVLVHAQVYEFFGFHPSTANPVAYANGSVVYTKPFTALDKYLVCRYLEKVYGLADEVAMNTNGTWSAYTLVPGNDDSNKDGIPDGWELYLMFGPEPVPEELGDAKISPFAEICGVQAYDYVRDPANTPDGGTLSILQKYNSGRAPTDPWAKYAGGGDTSVDSDDDGLPDYAEYLISEVFTNLVTSGSTDVPGYFDKVGKLYLGELFTDHDFMEDSFERAWSEIGADSAAYDAHLDGDEDGWSNWAEVRSKFDMGYNINVNGVKTNEITETFNAWTISDQSPTITGWESDWKKRVEEIQAGTLNGYKVQLLDAKFDQLGWAKRSDGGADEPYGSGVIRYYTFTESYGWALKYPGHPQPIVKMTVRYTGTRDFERQNLVVKAYTDADLKQCDATFVVVNGDNRNVNEVLLTTPNDGYLREGMNTFVVSVGTASNETSSASVLMGVARNVDVGWSGASFDVELTEESPICSRPEVIAGTNGTTHVSVYRYTVNGREVGLGNIIPIDYDCVLNKDIGSRSSLHEGDFLSDTEFDIDWSGFQSGIMASPHVGNLEDSGISVTSVTYRVYSQYVKNIVEEYKNTNSPLPYVEITRKFGATRATAEPVAPGEDSTIFYGAQPTFRWKMTGDSPDTFTAFAIQVQDTTGALVWNSGVRHAPPRNMYGEYVWTAPLYAGDQASAGKVFATTNNYTWAVTMYNSRYQDDFWSASRRFRVNVYGEEEVNNTDRCAVKAVVKYFGPGTFSTDVSKTNGILRVEAYTTPDFSGDPAGRTFVRDFNSVTNADSEVKVTIAGLYPGSYYIRAYIDSDGDFKHSNWESWGYACYRGDVDPDAIYAPKAVTANYGQSAPTAIVYVEDADVDQDCLPDIWEYDEAGADKTDFLLKKGPVENSSNGYISVSPELLDAMDALVNGGKSGSRTFASNSRAVPKTLAALMIGKDSVDPEIDEKTLAIKSLSLEDGEVKLVLGAEADDPTVGTVFVSDGKVRATIVVKYADSLGGEWNSVEVPIEKDIEDGSVSEEINLSLKALGLDASKGFFKVELKQ